MRAIGVGIVLAFATATAAFAQQDGDPAKGRQYALMVCAACHSVVALPPGASPSSPNQTQTGRAPSFEAIAATPGMTELALNVFFRSPHPSMPNLIVPTADMRDLIAYILSLRR